MQSHGKLFFVAMVCWASSMAGAAEFATFGLPYVNRPYGLSADGSTVVGKAHTQGQSEAFRWTRDSGMEFLGELSGREHRPISLGVSADGSVVVGYDSRGPSAYNWEAWRWTAGTGMIGLGYIIGGDPTYDLSCATDLSADGTVIVGNTTSPAGRTAFHWTEATGMVGIGDLSGGNFDSLAEGVSDDGNTIIGRSSAANGDEAFRWTAATGMVSLGALPGAPNPPWPRDVSVAFDVSADGEVVVGFAWDGSGQNVPFRWTEATGMVGIGVLDEQDDSYAHAVSEDGSVIVGESGGRAFIWTAQTGIRDLTDYLATDYNLDLQGYVLTNATGISNDGMTIVGMSDHDDSWIVVIPEPATLSLLALSGLAMLRKRR